MLLNELFVKELHEGGSIFPETSGIPKKMAPLVLKRLTDALPIELRDKIFATGSAGHKPYSSDLDVMIDNRAVQDWSKQANQKVAKTVLQQAIEQAGLPTRLSGVSIHVRVPMMRSFAQVDLMLVDDAKDISRFHQHDYATMGTAFKGVDIHHMLSAIAKTVKTQDWPNGLMWSGFQGLFTRGPDGKKAQLVTRNADEVAKLLLNPNASGKDLKSPQAIVAAIPMQERQVKLSDPTMIRYIG